MQCCHWWCCQVSHQAGVSGVSHDQKGHVAPHFNCLDLRNSVVSLIMLMVLHDQKVMLHLILIIFSYGMQWCYWRCCQHHMMLIPVPVAWHDQKSHIAPHFCHLGVRKTMIPLASSEPNSGTNGITWPRKSFCTSLSLLGHKECNDAIDNAISFIWCWCWYLWCHMTEKSHVAFYFDHLGYRSAMVPLTMLFESHDVNASTNASYDKEHYAASHFYDLGLRNIMLTFMML